MALTLPDELTMSQIWNAQWLASMLALSDGRPLHVVYRGVWTHGLGPDFANAFIDVDGSLLSGAIEMHRRSSDWYSHGHERDPAYDEVVLHVVWEDDLDQPVTRGDGTSVPTLLLPECLPGGIDEFASSPVLRPLGAIGFEFCAPLASELRPDDVRMIWERVGDERLRGKTDVVAARLALEPPAQVLYAMILDALGYTRNRDGMRAIAERLPYDHLEARLLGNATRARFVRAAGLLLGVGGFLPLSPREQEMGGIDAAQRNEIERCWTQLGAAWNDITVASSAWSLARVRPAAHPIRRLLALALLMSRIDHGLIEDLCSLIELPDAYFGVQRWLTQENPYLGRAHAHEIIVNAVVPFGLAYADATDQPELLDRAAELWAGIPSGRGNAVVERMIDQICGDHPLRLSSARAEQGLLHLHHTGCVHMRCFECPIAQLELMSTQPLPAD
ncbi:MAG: DUF2851 family protein [Nitrolancea sp.]